MELDEVRLCRFCVSLANWQAQHHQAKLPLRLSHHPKFGVLVASGQTCRLCQFIASLWKLSEDDLRRFASDSSSAQSNRDGFSVRISLKDGRDMGFGIYWALLEVVFKNNKTTIKVPCEFTIVTCDLRGKGASNPAWATSDTETRDKLVSIQSWLQECRTQGDTGHSACRPVPFAPLRLVSVGLDGNPPRLVRGDRQEGAVEYATLSHCWGGALPIRTTKAAVAEFSSAIPIQALPRTFTDAIQLARDLAIPFIWIDALCIVQDDPQEWQSEAARMGSVYRGSQVTISAVQSSNSAEGCYRSDESGQCHGETLFRTWSGKEDRPDLLVRIYRGDVRDRASSGTALSARGWTLQEQLLSKRVISCMRPEVHWSCQRHYVTESGLCFPRADKSRKGLPLQMPSDQNSHSQLSVPRHESMEHGKWTVIVKNYSNRSFTFPGDRVAGIAGIVRYMEAQLGEESILGLWKSSLSEDLGWMRIQREPEPAFHSLAESLPSWTWLTCQGGLTYDFWGWGEPSGLWSGREAQHHTSLLGWEVQWEGTPYTSAVVSAYLRVEGCISDIPIRPFAAGAASNPPYFQIFDEDENVRSAGGGRLPWRCKGQFDTGNVSDAATYTCLLLRSRRIVTRSSGLRVDEEFLILTPAGTSDSAEYRRIGLARIYGNMPVFDSSRKAIIILV
ncbi:HET-domain-containing protein [Thozetella sp. PMI_491]|nr:HET-domain-containing protein [Thozetella sp. PMI_491]